MTTVLEWVERDPSLQAVFRVSKEAAGDDPGHDLAHFLRVAEWTLRLGSDALEPRLAIAAALLHDIVNVPKNSPDRSRASELCAEKASHILRDAGFRPDEITLIHDAIRDHSYSRGARPTTLLGQALQDADRLEALGAIGIMRVFSTGVIMGAKYFHPEDPWARERPLDDKAYSVDHFFTKLLKLPDTMLTPAGRAEAEKRATTLRYFLERLGEEIAIR